MIIDKEIDDYISSMRWLSSLYTDDKIANAWKLIKFINDNFDKNTGPTIKINNHIIKIPESTMFNIIENNEQTPLKMILEKRNDSYFYDFSDEYNIKIILIIFTILTGDLKAFSFIDPPLLPPIYKFVHFFLPGIEKYLSSAINRIIAAVNEGKSEECINVLFNLIIYVNPKEYKINDAIGLAIWRDPKTSANLLGDEEIYNFVREMVQNKIKSKKDDVEKIKNSTKKIRWRDIYAVLLVIKYAPDEELAFLI